MQMLKSKMLKILLRAQRDHFFDLAERGSFSRSFLKFNQALDQTIEMATQAMQSDQESLGCLQD